ncbi:N-6 DNA methylase [Deinococcus sp.]|uniref:N-6 DNA methylase n=1 Tax=Deinococcus sp. TaxID=47478 RepID=UPI003CC54412
MTAAPSKFETQLRVYAQALQKAYASRTKANPEDQLKTPIKNFLESAGILAAPINIKMEVQEKGVAGRPDMGLEVKQLLSGHLELKAPVVGIDPKKFDERSRKQFERFRALPNLIYCSGDDWALYRSGELLKTVKLGDLTDAGEAALNPLQVPALEGLLRDFMTWQPITPATPRDLAEFLAPICRLVRDDVRSALQNPESAVLELAKDWRSTLFPETDDSEFADAYAQTLTYALLLARIRGASNLEPDTAAKALDAGHNLLAGALRILGSQAARDELGVGVDILIRCLSAFDPSDITGRLRRTWIHDGDTHYPTDDQAFTRKEEDPWLYFYEDFLAAYDKKLRNDYGVYYTPTPVILCQVRLVHTLLKTKLGRPLGLAEDSVTVLDPAAGTGAFPLAVLDQALAEAESVYGPGARVQVAEQLARNVHAFEFLVGPYAVAHLRLTQKIQQEGAALPKDGAHVYLTDTLEAPEERDLSSRGLLYKRLTDEHRRALKVKRDTRVLVCIGNPPYDRQERSASEKARGVQLKGGWVRFGAENINDETNGILKDYTESARLAGAGGHLRNLYNSYVYFWRWATWKVFEQNAQQPGIVCFITAASYLRGPGFVGMREHLRRTLDELWIIDLGGDNLGARKDDNVFAIRTPVCIALGVRYESNSQQPTANSQQPTANSQQPTANSRTYTLLPRRGQP